MTRPLPVLWIAFALAALSCTVRVDLPARGDASDLDGDSDETPIPCDEASECTDPEDRFCHPTLRVCVECITSADCSGGRTCVREADLEFECNLLRP